MTNFRTVKKNGKKQAVPIGNGSTKTYGRAIDLNKEVNLHNGYFRGEGDTADEAVDDMLNQMHVERSEILDGIEYFTDDGMSDLIGYDEVEDVGGANFIGKIYKEDAIYTLDGSVSKQGNKWVAGADTS